MKKKIENIAGVPSILVAASLGILLGWLAFSPIWLRNNGQLMDYGDYFIQYVPFIQELKRMISSGSMAWSWNSYLGDSFVGGYSYYTAFNPFAWFVACFPDYAILYGTMIATLLKLAVCMVSSMLYFRRFCGKDMYAILGALLYTFSGFTNVNTYFYFFLDTIAVFPLMMYGLERLLEDNKKGVYVAALVLNAAINLYFFVSTVIIVILYVFFRLELYRIRGWKDNLKRLLRVAVCSVIGTGIASFAVIPSIVSMFRSGKAMESVGAGITFEIVPGIVLHRLYSLIAPSESSTYCAFFYGSAWASTGAYLPVFGICCVLHHVLMKRDWLGKLSCALFAMYLVPVLNSIFSLFSNNNYTRWLYGLVLIFSLVTAKFLEEYCENKVRFQSKLTVGLAVFAMLYLGIPFAAYVLEYFGIPAGNRFINAFISPFFMGYAALTVMLLLAAANYILLLILTMRRKCAPSRLMICVAGMCMMNMLVFNALNYDLHDVDSQYSNQYYYQKTLCEGTGHQNQTFQFRIDHPKQIRNYGIHKNMASVNYFNSLQNPNSIRFAVKSGIVENVKMTIILPPEHLSVYTDALLSVKYYYDYDGKSRIPDGFVYHRTENHVDIYENKNYIPMGFVYDQFCTEEDLEGITPEQRCKAMLDVLVVGNEEAEFVKKYLYYEPDPDLDVSLSQMISDRRKETCSSFEGTSSGFSAQIDLDREQLVFFSIPNDAAWDIRVNGVPAETITVQYGLMGVLCQKGTNQITGVYHPEGIGPGVTCSVFFSLVFAGLELWDRKNKKTQLRGAM